MMMLMFYSRMFLAMCHFKHVYFVRLPTSYIDHISKSLLER